MLFDGNALVHRAYHAFGPTKSRPGAALTVRQTGEVVSAVYGFALIMLKVLNDLKPTHYAVAFDKKGPTFRHDMLDTYKANRPAAPDDLISQMDRVKELVRTFNIPLFELEKYEADDVIGTLTRQAVAQGVETVIVTGDADAMQLVSPAVSVFYPKGSQSFSSSVLYDAAMVKEKFGVGPEHVADYKALVGDASDNIKGVPGIGEKTAVKLITDFGGIDDIYKRVDEVAPPRAREILKNNEEVARRSLKLTTIVTDIPITLNLDECKVTNYDHQKAVDLFRELEFSSLISKLPSVAADNGAPAVEVKSSPPSGDYKIVSDAQGLDALVNVLTQSPAFAFDTETTGFYPMLDKLVGISVSAEPGVSYYVPVGHVTLDEVTQLPLEQVVNRLKPVFEDSNITKYGHNAKFDMNVLAQAGIAAKGVTFDTSIAAHLLGNNSIGLKDLAFNKLAVEMTPIASLIGVGSRQITMDKVPIKTAAAYAAADADMTFRLQALFRQELETQGLMKLFTDVEMPLVPVLLAMERSGVAIDKAILAELSSSLGAQADELAKKIYEEAKHEFNINSPAQLGKILFEEMQIPFNKRGKYSTDASVLESLRPMYPIAGYVLQYRTLTKLKSTYIDALPQLVNPNTGRIHTSFNQTRTSTGRLSSSDPNMQNIPVRGELGGQVRQAFIAAPGFSLLAGDYSQIDLRALAHLSQDEVLIRAFRNDEDIHAATASLLFGVEKDKITKDMRRFAKTINFGVIYGMSEYGLEQATELSREEAGKFIKAYFEKYPGVTRYLENVRAKARQDGYVETILGRRRYMGPDINSSNRQVREAAERMAINMPVQGTSADIIKVAMINLAKEMEQRRVKSRLLLQVHDELVFEVPAEEMDFMRKLVSDVMDSALVLSVPLKVDTKSGANWGDMK